MRPEDRHEVPAGWTGRGAVQAEPLSVRIAAAVQLTGISRSRLYELIQSGDLDTVKIGRSTLIPYASLRNLIERNRL